MSRLPHLLAAAASSAALLFSAGAAHADAPFAAAAPTTDVADSIATGAGVAPLTPAAAAPFTVTAAPGTAAGFRLAASAPQGRVLGGAQATVTTAPWTAFLLTENDGGSVQCDGAIINPTTIVTAAHCVTGRTIGAAVDKNGIGVAVGIADYGNPDPTGQYAIVTAARVHPQWTGDIQTSSGGDIAVLTVNKAFDLSGPAVRAIALPAPAVPAGDPLVAPQPAVVSGFGLESASGDPSGKLNTLQAAVVSPDACGGLMGDSAAVDLCVQSPSGTVCEGDSGSGLVSAGPNPVLLGIVSAGPVPCAAGQGDLFTSVVAPENRVFIDGGTPVIAPRPSGSYKILGGAAPTVGSTITCSGPTWSGSPSLKFAVTNETGAVLATGAGATFAYVVAATDLGHKLTCRQFATNAGGVGQSPGLTTGTVTGAGPAPAPPITTPSTSTKRAVPGDGRIKLEGPHTVRRGHTVHWKVRLSNVTAGTTKLVIFFDLDRAHPDGRVFNVASGQTAGWAPLTVKISRHAKMGVSYPFLDGEDIADSKELAYHAKTVRIRVTR